MICPFCADSRRLWGSFLEFTWTCLSMQRGRKYSLPKVDQKNFLYLAFFHFHHIPCVLLFLTSEIATGLLKKGLEYERTCFHIPKHALRANGHGEAICPNLACCARGKRGEGNITINDRKRQQYRCQRCKQTFRARCGTMFEGLRKPMEIIVIPARWEMYASSLPRVAGS